MNFDKQWVDPAEGWKYGFPRIYCFETDGPLREWLIKCGYPEAYTKFPIRFWDAEEPKEDKE